MGTNVTTGIRVLHLCFFVGNIKTLFEPCLSCKKQIVIWQQLYNIQYLSIEATRFDKTRYVVENKEFLKVIK